MNLSPDQDGSIELGNSAGSGTTPYIDFHRGVGSAQDYNVRLVNDANARLTVDGDLNVTGTITPPSDRNVKRDFAPVDGRAVLDKVAALPIQSWAYKSAADIRHLGPVAQDFKAAFGLGADDKHIATVDADGVALAAIQGLYALIKEQQAEIAQLKTRLMALESARNIVGQPAGLVPTASGPLALQQRQQ
jgi:hypothetical protein